jgi:hypothetical protein
MPKSKNLRLLLKRSLSLICYISCLKGEFFAPVCGYSLQDFSTSIPRLKLYLKHPCQLCRGKVMEDQKALYPFKFLWAVFLNVFILKTDDNFSLKLILEDGIIANFLQN